MPESRYDPKVRIKAKDALEIPFIGTFDIATYYADREVSFC